MKTKSEIKSILTTELQRRHEIIFAYWFGSSLNDGPYHDIDIGVFFDSKNPPAGLAYSLERDLEWPVDIVELNRAPDHLTHEISKGVLMVDRNPLMREEFLSAVWGRYLDFSVKRRAYAADLASE